MFLLFQTIVKHVTIINKKVKIMGSLKSKFVKNTIIDKIIDINDIIINLFFQLFISSLHKCARINPAGKPSNNNRLYNINNNVSSINYLSSDVF